MVSMVSERDCKVFATDIATTWIVPGKGRIYGRFNQF